MKKTRVKVLCVDDEPQVLEGLALHLRRGFDVHKATSGALGLEAIELDGPFAVVVSDMRMPLMDGAAFLSRVRQASPDTVRMLLTGHADIQSAIAAVNEGQIFRFLTKPCPPEQLRSAFFAAAEQYRLVTAERVLLEQTLKGSIQALVDILALTSPAAFGRAQRVQQLASELAEAIGLKDLWQIEVAALLSQLGAVTLPEETVEKYSRGRDLTAEEKAMVARLPSVTEELLTNIPRLEQVREILSDQRTRFDAQQGRRRLSLGARILKLALELDELESRGLSVRLALETMHGRVGWYDPDLLQRLIDLKNSEPKQEIREVSLRSLSVGMVFAEDVRTASGVLLVSRGYEVTTGFLERLRHFRKEAIAEPLRVAVKTTKDGPSSDSGRK